MLVNILLCLLSTSLITLIGLIIIPFLRLTSFAPRASTWRTRRRQEEGPEEVELMQRALELLKRLIRAEEEIKLSYERSDNGFEDSNNLISRAFEREFHCRR
jgi:hypothetical protein